MSDLEWKTDVQLACSGDRDAFTRLIREMQNELYRMVRSLLHKDEDCGWQNAVNAFMGLWRCCRVQADS